MQVVDVGHGTAAASDVMSRTGRFEWEEYDGVFLGRLSITLIVA